MNAKYKTWTWVIALSCISLSSCKKEDFVELNTNPVTLDKITPEQEFMDATIRLNTDRLEWYYDNLRGIMPWMQMSTPLNGNGLSFISESGNMRNVRYNMFYPSIGAALTDIQVMISQMPEEEQAKRSNQVAIAGIVKAYYAFYVSDINGSIPYTEAFRGKYDASFTPKYDTQPELFDILEEELKSHVATLSATPAVPQTSYGDRDMFFGGDVSKWIKTANAVRLKMAMRLMKRDPSKMATRVQEILQNTTQMESNDDSWIFEANATYAAGGDWSALNMRAPKPTVDFMYENADPRIRFFYQPNYFNQANFDLAKAQGKIPAAATNDPRRYYGAPTNPETAAAAPAQIFFNSVTVSKPGSTGLVGNVSLDTLSNLQPRMFAAGENAGTGVNFFLMLTYSDYCFMRAELAARALTGDNAKEWYDKGITASIKMYDEMANRAKITDRENVGNYLAATDEEIQAYLARPLVSYNPAIGLDQIACQAYLNFFKQPNEAWALFKRTGLPNPSSIIKLERMIIGGAEQQIPRRASLPFPSPSNLNYQNITGAFADMAKDPDFGAGASDIFGRVWWDKK
jgi:hypothetical protein